MQITNNSSGSGVKVNLIKGVSSEAIAEALIRINEQELNIIGYESQTKTYRDETSVLRDNAQVSANNANTSATNANNSALLSTTKANEAILSANNALTYRNEAETFKNNAKASEINADLRATAASTSEVNAKSSELLALQYKDTTLSLKEETLLLKNETVSNAITATEQATISTSNAIITEQQAQIATTKASESLVNANNAKASELLSAQYKADNESIKTNVQTLSNSAYDSANTASIKANEASDSAIVSTTQANISITKASEASTYATNSNTSAVTASASENKAEEWASKEYGLEVEPGLYSAKHYATESNNALISMNSSVNPLSNTVVKRDNNSDILTRTLNTTIESTSDIATKYYVETNNDGYLRPKVLSDVRTEIAGDKVTKTGDETIAGVKTFSSSPIVPTPTTGTQAANKDYVDNVAAADRIGLIDYGYVAKPYHIVAFGGEFNRADYPKLWTYLQANPSLVKTQDQWTTENNTNGMCGFFSSGNDTTTFRVPNLNQAFLRPDSRNIASYQSDAFQQHNHKVYCNTSSPTVETTRSVPNPGNDTAVWNTPFTRNNAATDLYAAEELQNGNNPLKTDALETRPKNIAVLPLIVAK